MIGIMESILEFPLDRNYSKIISSVHLGRKTEFSSSSTMNLSPVVLDCYAHSCFIPDSTINKHILIFKIFHVSYDAKVYMFPKLRRK